MTTLTVKHCPDCQTTLPAASFYRAARTRDGLQSVCKDCQRERRRINRASLEPAYRKWRQRESRARWAANNPEAETARRLRRFKVTTEEYQAALARQNHRCGICQRHVEELDRALAVDHCHKTQRFRGLLCFNCNVSIGKLGDTAEAVARALDYLKRAETTA